MQARLLCKLCGEISDGHGDHSNYYITGSSWSHDYGESPYRLLRNEYGSKHYEYLTKHINYRAREAREMVGLPSCNCNVPLRACTLPHLSAAHLLTICLYMINSLSNHFIFFPQFLFQILRTLL